MSFCEMQPSLKKNHPKLASQESSPVPTTRYTSTHQRKNTEKDAEALLRLAPTLTYTPIKDGFRLESITPEWVPLKPQPKLPGGHYQLRYSSRAVVHMTRSLARDSIFLTGTVSSKRLDLGMQRLRTGGP